MRQPKSSQILGLSAVAALLVACVIVAHSLIKEAIATRTSSQTCWTLRSAAPLCYGDPLRLTSQTTTAIAVSPDGKLLAASIGKTIQLWDLPQKTPRRSLQQHTDWITAIAISPNGHTLASSSLDQTIKLWDLPTGTLQASLPAGRMTSLAFSPDGTTLASATRLVGNWNPHRQPSIYLWDLTTRRVIRQIDSGVVTAIAISPDGQTIAGGDKTTGLWNISSGQKLHTLESNDLNALIFSRTGEMLITGSDGVRGEDGIKFWQVSSGKQLRNLDSVAADFALSPDGKTLATTYGGIVNLWRSKPFGFLGTLRGSEYSGLVVEFTIANRIITGSSDGVRLWEPEPHHDIPPTDPW